MRNKIRVILGNTIVVWVISNDDDNNYPARLHLASWDSGACECGRNNENDSFIEMDVFLDKKQLIELKNDLERIEAFRKAKELKS